MSGVKKTMDEYDDMMGIPLGIQPGEERLHYDPNCHYGGYTIDGVGNDGHLCIGGGTSVVHPAFINEMLESFGDGVAGHEKVLQALWWRLLLALRWRSRSQCLEGLQGD